jgi:molybdate transport system substrate-binding protein
MAMKVKISVFSLFFIVLAVSYAHSSPNEILIFAGAASKPATEEAIRLFEEKTGVTARILFGGSGFVLSQMKLAKRGDLYFPGSSDFMEIAKKENLVYSDSERIVVYLIPAINVQKGNPKRIYSLRDLTRNGIRLAIANPETVCVGTYAVEIIEKNMTSTEKKYFKRNLVNYTESCEKTANVISLKAVDAVIGWRVFQYWDPERIETVYLKRKEIARIGYIPIAVSRFTKNRKGAETFIDFLLSSQGKTLFKKYQYLMDPQEARRFATSSTPIGGAYQLPEDWKPTKRKEEKP